MSYILKAGNQDITSLIASGGDHNALNNVQGGSDNERYHLTSASYTQLLSNSSSYALSASWSPQPVIPTSVSSASWVSSSVRITTADTASYITAGNIANNYSASVSTQLGTKQPTLTNQLYTITASLATSASYYPTFPTNIASASWASSSLSASVLSISRSINGIGFNGSSDITIQGTDWSPVFARNGTDVINYGKDIFTFLKTGADGGWTTKVYSKQGYTSSLYASCKPTSTNQTRILGLNSNPTDALNDYSDIDYGWYMTSIGGTAIVRNGSIVGDFGNYTTNSVFDLTYDGVSIKYWWDNVLITSSLRAIGLPLYLDCYLNTPNGSGITEVKFGTLPYIPTQNGAYDIGSTTKKFNNAYFSGSVTAPNFVGTASVAISASYAPGGLITGETYSITSSWASSSISASYAPGTLTTGGTYSITSSWAISASYAPASLTGSVNYIPKWNGGGNSLTSTSSIYDGITTYGIVLNTNIPWIQRTSPLNTNNKWGGLTYASGTFVAVGGGSVADQYSSVMTSTNGISWSLQTSSMTINNWNAIDYGNNTFVAVGGAGDTQFACVMTSPDAITWTQRTSSVSGANNTWNSIIFVSGSFVAVGGSGVSNARCVMTSSNGITWTSPNSSLISNNSWFGITYGSGTFVAVGGQGGSNLECIMTSPNGINWTERTSSLATGNYWRGITYGSGTFVAVGGSSSDQYSCVMTSPDAITWTQRTSSLAGASNNWHIIEYISGTFIAVGGFGADQYSCVMISSDGINWVQKTSSLNTSTNCWNALSYIPGTLVAVGGWGWAYKAGTDVIMTNTFTGYSITGSDVVSINKQLLVNGISINTTSSTALLNLKSLPIEFLPDTGWTVDYDWTGSRSFGWVHMINGVTGSVYNNKPAVIGTQYVVSYVLSGDFVQYYWSFGGTSQSNIDSTGTKTFTATTTESLIISTKPGFPQWTGATMSVSISPSVGDPFISLRDKTEVSKLTIDGNGNVVANGYISASSFTGSLLGTASLAISASYAPSGTSLSGTNNYVPLWSSNNLTSTSSIYDGLTTVTTSYDVGLTKWTAQTTQYYFSTLGVTYGSGTFVIVGSGTQTGSIMTSPDGYNWTFRTSSIIGQNDLYGATYASGTFVVVGGEGSNQYKCVITSPDAITWTTGTGSFISNNYLKSIAYGSGTFVAVGGFSSTANDCMMRSPNAITWTAITSAFSSNDLTKIIYAKTGSTDNTALFVVVGNQNTINTNCIQTSPNAITWTKQTSSLSGNVNNWRSVAWAMTGSTSASGIFVAVGGGLTGPTTATQCIMTSPDAVTWTTRTSPISINYWRDITYTSGKFIAVGGFNATTPSASAYTIITSTDGITWNPQVNATPLYYGVSITSNNIDTVVACGLNGNTQKCVMTSAITNSLVTNNINVVNITKPLVVNNSITMTSITSSNNPVITSRYLDGTYLPVVVNGVTKYIALYS